MITHKAMLAAVHISVWAATRHDRKVSREIADQDGARERAGRYNKQLLMRAIKLEELRSLAGQVRQHFYKVTLPRSDEGLRLLPSHFLFDLKAKMREFEREFNEGVASFLAVYPEYIRIGRSLPRRGLPFSRKMTRQIGIKLDVLPFPAGADFRLEMSAEEQHVWLGRSTPAPSAQSPGGYWRRYTSAANHRVISLAM